MGLPFAFNLCNVSPWTIASREFNDDPVELVLDGAGMGNRFLFERLDEIDDPVRRGEVFNEYMSVRFHLHQWNQHENAARSSLRNSYLRFLAGWGRESNGVEGAVLKGWVESRFGVRPSYHRGKLTTTHSEEYLPYAVDRMKGHARTNAIHSQLDALFTFCQYELKRRAKWDRWVTLYRGTNDVEEHTILEREGRRRLCVLLNNLCSFTLDREKAWEFGSHVWQARVPLVKIVFFSDLLPDSILRGEDEFMVIGGEYWVTELLY